MAGVLVNKGEKIMLEAFVNKTAPQDLRLKLFKSNTTPVETTVAADLTEADFTGYADALLSGASWGAASEGAPSSIAYAQQTFTSSANQATQQVYGYYLVQNGSGLLVAAERFADGPYPISNLNDQIKVTPTITMD